MTKFTHPGDAQPGHKWCLRKSGKEATHVSVMDHPAGYRGHTISYFIGNQRQSRRLDGHCFDTLDSHDDDLIDVPVEKTVWLNMYPGGATSVHHHTRDEADRIAMPPRIACVKVTYTEGQFDE